MLRRLALLLPLLLLPSGCVLLPTLGGPPPRSAEARRLVPPRGFLDVRGIVHCHSKQSHDSRGELSSIAAAASEVGAAFVVLTDHLAATTDDEGPDGPLDGVLFIPGLETRADRGGSILSIGARAGIDPRGSDEAVVAAIRSRGGIVGLGHPERIRLGGAIDEAAAVELMNLHADVLDESWLTLFLRVLFFPPRPFFSSVVDRNAEGARLYDALARDRPVAALGACDAHEAIRPLGPLAGAIDSYRRVFRTASTHVLVREPTKAAILEALRAGRSYAACELVEDATGFSFTARGRDGHASVLGEEVRLEDGIDLLVEAPVPCGISILKDGAPVLVEKEASGAKWPVRTPGAYRVEATLGGRPWVATSAIRVVR